MISDLLDPAIETKGALQVLPDPPPVETRRMGRFRVSYALAAQWTRCLPIFAGMFVVRAGPKDELRCFEYVAVGGMFEPCEVGSVPSLYEAEVEQANDGSINVKWTRKG